MINKRKILDSRIDIKTHEYVESMAGDFVKGNLRDPRLVEGVIDKSINEVWSNIRQKLE